MKRFDNIPEVLARAAQKWVAKGEIRKRKNFKKVLTNAKASDTMPKALATVSAREFEKELKNKFKNSQKKLLTKQTTCGNINELLLSGNSTLTNKQQCNPERFLINRM